MLLSSMAVHVGNVGNALGNVGQLPRAQKSFLGEALASVRADGKRMAACAAFLLATNEERNIAAKASRSAGRLPRQPQHVEHLWGCKVDVLGGVVVAIRRGCVSLECHRLRSRRVCCLRALEKHDGPRCVPEESKDMAVARSYMNTRGGEASHGLWNASQANYVTGPRRTMHLSRNRNGARTEPVALRARAKLPKAVVPALPPPPEQPGLNHM